MPIEVDEICNRHAGCTVQLEGGRSVTFEYLPVSLERVLEDDGADVERPDSLQQSREAVAARIAEVVVEWDITRKGEPFPLDADEIAGTFDIGFLNRCYAGLVEHYTTGKANGELLSRLGAGITSPAGATESSPATKAKRASRRLSKSPKSRSSADSPRGNLQRISTGSTSSAPGYRPATAS